MRFSSEIHLYPSGGYGIYHFFCNTINHWQFIEDLPSILKNETDRKAVGMALDDAVRLWNDFAFAHHNMDECFFVVHQKINIPEDMVQNGKLFPAGSTIYASLVCELILAHINNSTKIITDHKGETSMVTNQKSVELQCTLAPPKKHLKVITVPSFPLISVIKKENIDLLT